MVVAVHSVGSGGGAVAVVGRGRLLLGRLVVRGGAGAGLEAQGGSALVAVAAVLHLLLLVVLHGLLAASQLAAVLGGVLGHLAAVGVSGGGGGASVVAIVVALVGSDDAAGVQQAGLAGQGLATLAGALQVAGAQLGTLCEQTEKSLREFQVNRRKSMQALQQEDSPQPAFRWQPPSPDPFPPRDVL